MRISIIFISTLIRLRMKHFFIFCTLLNLLCPVYSQTSNIVLYDPPPHKGVFMGMYSLDGKEILPAKYGYYELINEKLIHIIDLKEDQKIHGIIDYKEKKVLPSIYNSIKVFANKYFVTSLKENDQTSKEPAKYSYEITDFSGKVLFRKLDEISIFQNYCIIKKEGQYAILDKTLNYIMPYNKLYSNLMSWNETDSLFVAKDKATGKSALITTSHRNITPFIYDNISRYTRAKKRGQKGIPDSYYTAKINEKIGALSLSGYPLVEVEYDDLVRVNDSLFFFSRQKSNYRWGENNYSWGVYNTNKPIGEIIPCKYNIQDQLIRDNYIFLKDSISRGVVYDLSGKEVIPGGNFIRPLQNGYWETSSDYMLWGVVDNYNKEVIPHNYHFVDSLTSSLFRLNFDNYQGIADIKGNMIIPAEYDSIKINNDCNLLSAYKDSTLKYYSLDGNLLKTNKTFHLTVKPVSDQYLAGGANAKNNDIHYNDIKWNGNGKLIVVEGYRYGVIDSLGNVLIPTKYRMIEPGYKKNSFEVCDTDNNWYLFTENNGIYTNSGEIAYRNYNEQENKKKRKFIHIHPIKDYEYQLYEVTFEDKTYGLANADMKVITTIGYDWISRWCENLFLVEKYDRKKGIVNNKGKEIVPVKYSWIKLESEHGIDYLRVTLNTNK